MLRGKVEGEDPSSRRSRKLLVRRGGLGGRPPGGPPAAFATFRRAKSRPTPTQAAWKRREIGSRPSDTQRLLLFFVTRKVGPPHSSSLEEERDPEAALRHPAAFATFRRAKSRSAPSGQTGRRENRATASCRPAAFAAFRRAKSRPTPAVRKAGPLLREAVTKNRFFDRKIFFSLDESPEMWFDISSGSALRICSVQIRTVRRCFAASDRQSNHIQVRSGDGQSFKGVCDPTC